MSESAAANARSDEALEQHQRDITSVTIQQYLSNIRITKPTSISRFNKLINRNNKKPFFLFIGFKECPYCRRFSPVFSQFFKYKKAATTYYVNTDTFGVNEKVTPNARRKVVAYLKDKIQVKTTPTTVATFRGRVIGALDCHQPH